MSKAYDIEKPHLSDIRAFMSVERETLRQDALCAWDDYQVDGLHLTLEEADAWLIALALGADVEPPKCHA